MLDAAAIVIQCWRVIRCLLAVPLAQNNMALLSLRAHLVTWCV